MKMPSQKWLLYICLLLSGFALAVIFYLFTSQLSHTTDTIKGIFTALQPIFLGIIMTYLLYPLSNNFEQVMLRWGIRKKLARLVSVLSSAIFLVFLFFLFGYLVLPELISSITALLANFNGMLNEFLQRTSAILATLDLPAETITEQWKLAAEKFTAWLQNDLINTLLSITSGLFSVAKVAMNLIFGIFVMVYLLLSRDQFIGQSKKTLYAFCRNRKACSVVLDSVRQINQIFGGFLTGKVIDSLIIGVICFVSLSLLNIPYTMIISVVVGVTNIIPVFGPFIGAIPCAFLLLLTDPAKCLVFIIFIIILQQIDGNIIGPMILGDSTGLPAFWVLFSLLLFQYLLGFWGMIVGVPLFASFYYLIKQLVNYLLKQRELPVSSLDYTFIDRVTEDGTPLYLSPKTKKSFVHLFKKHKKEAIPEKPEQDPDSPAEP